MVRHQLPLHGAGVPQGSDLHARLAQADRGISRKQRALGYQTRPVLVGPVTFLQAWQEHRSELRSAVAARRVAAGLYRGSAASSRNAAPNGCSSMNPVWFSISTITARQALQRAYAAFAKAVPSLKIMLTTYFGGLGDNLRQPHWRFLLPASTSTSSAHRISSTTSSAAHRTDLVALARRHRWPQRLAGESRCLA